MKQVFVFLIVIINTLSLQANLQFVENEGQWSEGVHACVVSSAGSVSLVSDGITFLIATSKCSTPSLESSSKTQFKLQWIDCNEVVPEMLDEQETLYNFFIGATEEHWRSGVHSYSKVKYHNLYDGIDLLVYSKKNILKYDFIVHPGADPSQIGWRYLNAEGQLRSDGSISILNELNTITDNAPFTYQVVGTSVEEVSCKNVHQDGAFSFDVGTYDTAKNLIIDPEINWSTYSEVFMEPQSSAVNSQDQTILVGQGFTIIDFEDTVVFSENDQTTGAGIQCVSADGTHVEWYTIIVGLSGGFSNQVEVTEEDDILLYGFGFDEFPTTPNVYQPNEGFQMMFKLTPTGDSITHATFIDFDELKRSQSRMNVVDVSQIQRKALFSLRSTSQGYLLSYSAIDLNESYAFTNYYGEIGGDVSFYAMLSEDFSELLWTTALASSGEECSCTPDGLGSGCDIQQSFTKVLSEGTILSCGWANCPAGFISEDAYDTSFEGDDEAWIAKLDLETGELLHATYVGGNGLDQASIFSETPLGDIGLVGITTSTDFETSHPMIENGRVFVKEFTPSLVPTGVAFRVGFDETGLEEDNLKNVIPVVFGYDACSNPVVFVEANGYILTQLDTETGLLGWPLVNNITDEGPAYYFHYDRFSGGLFEASYFGGGSFHSKLWEGIPDDGILNIAFCAHYNVFGENSFLPITEGAMEQFPTINQSHVTQFDFSEVPVPNTEAELSVSLVETDCVSSSYQLSADFLGGQEYEWLINGESAAVTNSNETLLNLSEFGPNEVELVLTFESGGCSFENTVSVEIDVPETGSDLVAAWEVSSVDTCFYPQEVFLSFTGEGANEYTWTLPEEVVEGAPETQFSITEPGTYQYGLQVYDALCDSSLFLSGSVVIYDAPGISLDYSISENGICDPMDLVSWIDGEEVISVSWAIDNETIETAEELYINLLDGQYALAATVERSCGPDEFLSEIITVNELPSNYIFEIPNVFTPQQDAVNDYFQLIQPLEEEKVAFFDFRVFNTWGQEVFQSGDVNFRWDGEVAGNVLSDGTYFYTLKFQLHCSDEEVNQSGDITILR